MILFFHFLTEIKIAIVLFNKKMVRDLRKDVEPYFRNLRDFPKSAVFEHFDQSLESTDVQIKQSNTKRSSRVGRSGTAAVKEEKKEVKRKMEERPAGRHYEEQKK